MSADPKPRPRTRDRNAGIAKLRREGCCRICGRVPSAVFLDALNRAHLVPRGQQGDDVDENIVPVCGSGTSGCHGDLHTSGPRRQLAAMRLRENLLPEEEAYIIEKKGAEWLNAWYPPRLA